MGPDVKVPDTAGSKINEPRDVPEIVSITAGAAAIMMAAPPEAPRPPVPSDGSTDPHAGGGINTSFAV